MMPPNIEPTDQILSDVTQRLQALNRSQTSLASMTSSRSMPVARASGTRATKHACDLCLKQCTSSTQLQFHRQTHVMENMAVRLKSSKAANSPEGLKAKEEHARQSDLERAVIGPTHQKGSSNPSSREEGRRSDEGRHTSPPRHTSVPSSRGGRLRREVPLVETAATRAWTDPILLPASLA